MRCFTDRWTVGWSAVWQFVWGGVLIAVWVKYRFVERFFIQEAISFIRYDGIYISNEIIKIILLCWHWRNTWWWILRAPPLTPCHFCSCQRSERRKRCQLRLGKSCESWLCSSRLAIWPLQSSHKSRLHFHHRCRWFSWIKKVVPGKITALFASEKASIFNLVVVSFISSIGRYLGLGVVGWGRESEAIHYFKFIDILAMRVYQRPLFLFAGLGRLFDLLNSSYSCL